MIDADEFIKLIRPIGCVKAVVHGHSHEYGFTEIEFAVGSKNRRP